MQDFFTIAKTDFLDTFQGAWIFPLLLIVLVFIFWKEKDDMRRLLLGVLPLLFLFIYWCPLTGMLFMKLLTGRAQMFADVRTYWSGDAVKRVTGYDLEG